MQAAHPSPPLSYETCIQKPIQHTHVHTHIYTILHAYVCVFIFNTQWASLSRFSRAAHTHTNTRQVQNIIMNQKHTIATKQNDVSGDQHKTISYLHQVLLFAQLRPSVAWTAHIHAHSDKPSHTQHCYERIKPQTNFQCTTTEKKEDKTIPVPHSTTHTYTHAYIHTHTHTRIDRNRPDSLGFFFFILSFDAIIITTIVFGVLFSTTVFVS